MPKPAETARTIVDLCQEGTLSTLMGDTPLGTAVAYKLNKEGHPVVVLPTGGVELQNLARNAKCSLQVQPTAFPARAVASVTLVGRLQPTPEQQELGTYTMDVEKCLYFGGLDQVGKGRSWDIFCV